MTKAVQEDIFSLFGIEDEYAIQKKREEEERQKKAEELRKQIASKQAAAQESSKSEPKEKEKDSFDINENTIIRFLGESLDIFTYFTSEEIAEGLLVKKADGETERKPLTGELLRKRMEKDFPELTKDMTEMVYLKDKNIIVTIQKAKKKGNCMETSSLEGVSSLSIPFSILKEFISLARFFGEHSLEVHADIYKRNDQYFLDVPKQKVHKYWCEVTEVAYRIATRVEDAVKVCEIHSHHFMKPTPSLQDNESERLPGMVYAIVGCIQKPFPDISVRMFISEEDGFVSLPYNTVFEDPFTTLPIFEMSNFEVVVS